MARAAVRRRREDKAGSDCPYLPSPRLRMGDLIQPWSPSLSTQVLVADAELAADATCWSRPCPDGQASLGKAKNQTWLEELHLHHLPELRPRARDSGIQLYRTLPPRWRRGTRNWEWARTSCVQPLSVVQDEVPQNAGSIWGRDKTGRGKERDVNQLCNFSSSHQHGGRRWRSTATI